MYLPLIIYAVLLTPFVLSLLSNAIFDTKITRLTACYLSLSVSFFVFAAGHFLLTDDMAAMLPPFVPAAKMLVYGTGVIEFCIGFFLLISKFRRAAALAALVCIVLFFSANIYAAFSHLPIGGYAHGPIWLCVRGPVQTLLALWAYFLCYKEKPLLF